MAPRITSSSNRSRRKSKQPVTKGQNPQRSNRQAVSTAQVTQGNTQSRYRPLQGPAAANVTESGWSGNSGAASRVTNNTPPPIVKSPGGGLVTQPGGIQPPGVGATGPRGMRPRLPAAGAPPVSLRVQPVNVRVMPGGGNLLPTIGGTGQRLLNAAKGGPHPLAILGNLVLGSALGQATGPDGVITNAIMDHLLTPLIQSTFGPKEKETPIPPAPAPVDMDVAEQSFAAQEAARETQQPTPEAPVPLQQEPYQASQAPQAPQAPQVSPEQARRQQFNQRYDEMRKMVEAGTLDEELFAEIGMMMHKHYFGKK